MKTARLGPVIVGPGRIRADQQTALTALCERPLEDRRMAREIRRLLNEGEDPNEANVAGALPMQLLLICCKKDPVLSAGELLRGGADPDRRRRGQGKEDFGLVGLAIKAGFTEVAGLLIMHGGSIEPCEGWVLWNENTAHQVRKLEDLGKAKARTRAAGLRQKTRRMGELLGPAPAEIIEQLGQMDEVPGLAEAAAKGAQRWLENRVGAPQKGTARVRM